MHANAAMWTDGKNSNTCLFDPAGGGVSFYDTHVALEPVTTGSQARLDSAAWASSNDTSHSRSRWRSLWVYSSGRSLRHQSWKAAGERGLTPTQSQILALLASRPAEVGVKVVAEQLAVTMATASEAITALERKGLLTKVASPSDGRALLLRLTRPGRKEARRCSEWPEVLVQAAGALPPSEQAGLVRGLIGMIRELQERGAVPLARMCVGCRFFRPNTAPGQPRAHYCAYIQAPIGDVELRVDCPEMEPVSAEMGPRLWNTFVAGTPLDDDSNPVAP